MTTSTATATIKPIWLPLAAGAPLPLEEPSVEDGDCCVELRDGMEVVTMMGSEVGQG